MWYQQLMLCDLSTEAQSSLLRKISHQLIPCEERPRACLCAAISSFEVNHFNNLTITVSISPNKTFQTKILQIVRYFLSNRTHNSSAIVSPTGGVSMWRLDQQQRGRQDERQRLSRGNGELGLNLAPCPSNNLAQIQIWILNQSWMWTSKSGRLQSAWFTGSHSIRNKMELGYWLDKSWPFTSHCKPWRLDHLLEVWGGHALCMSLFLPWQPPITIHLWDVSFPDEPWTLR